MIERDADGNPLRLYLSSTPAPCLHPKEDWYHAGGGFELRCVECGLVFHEVKVQREAKR
jgi:hypothetical protein